MEITAVDCLSLQGLTGPDLVSFHCTYVRAWISVKHTYALTTDEEEHAALTGMFDSCT